MIALIRYAGIAVMLLFLVSVALVCGEAVCESCVHACCPRALRVGKLHRVPARLKIVLAGASERLAVAVATPGSLHQFRLPSGLVSAAPASLRI